MCRNFSLNWLDHAFPIQNSQSDPGSPCERAYRQRSPMALGPPAPSLGKQPFRNLPISTNFFDSSIHPQLLHKYLISHPYFLPIEILVTQLSIVNNHDLK